MRHCIIVLFLIGTARILLAQEALNAGLPELSARVKTDPTTAWLDLRQTTKATAPQAAPDWVESVTLIAPDQVVDIGKPTVFRIRLHKPADDYRVLFFRLFFFDKATAHPKLVAWDESGSQLLRSGPLGSGIDLESSDSVMVPMHGVSCVDVEVPGDGTGVRSAYLEWMTSSELVHSEGNRTQDSVVQPFSATTRLQMPARDLEEFGTVTAPLSADPIRIGVTSDQGAVFEFGIESLPLLALLSFEIATPKIDSPPEVIVNGQNVGPVSLLLPMLADPGYRGEMRSLLKEMQFQYTGWIRAQRLVPVASLKSGNNQIVIINGADAAGSVIRATQIELKYLWDKSDYILKPGR